VELTPEQKQQLSNAKATGQQRVTMQFTAEQKQQYQAAIAVELAGKAENISHIRKIQAAAEQPGFFGDVRRAIALCRRPVAELAQHIGVDPHLFSDFRAGEADLPPAALDRLLETLGLRLMQEIRR
jgi:hypothetical protein